MPLFLRLRFYVNTAPPLDAMMTAMMRHFLSADIQHARTYISILRQDICLQAMHGRRAMTFSFKSQPKGRLRRSYMAAAMSMAADYIVLRVAARHQNKANNAGRRIFHASYWPVSFAKTSYSFSPSISRAASYRSTGFAWRIFLLHCLTLAFPSRFLAFTRRGLPNADRLLFLADRADGR